jgi:type I restriction enzyme S subunit
MSSQYTQNIIQKLKDGQGVPHLFQDDLRKFWIWLPSMDEQCGIAVFLDQKTLEIENIISHVQTQIDKLKEYRQSLISEAVTGKIDVRDYSPTEEVDSIAQDACRPN